MNMIFHYKPVSTLKVFYTRPFLIDRLAPYLETIFPPFLCVYQENTVLNMCLESIE